VLASSAAFKNRVVQDCLNVLHTDIVAVWNFHDPYRVMVIFFVATLSSHESHTVLAQQRVQDIDCEYGR
jgi:hypothetical protein